MNTMASSRKAEHDDEIEVLESIYPEELNLIETEPFNKFSIKLKGQPPQEIDEIVECELYFEHTANYPDEEPIYEIRECVGIEDSQLESLQKTFSETIEQNMGMPMIFTIISEAQEKLNAFAETLSEAQDEAAQHAQRELEAAEKAKFHGTPVTVETFVKWRIRFEEELREKLTVKVQASPKKLTGKQMFLQDSTFDKSDLQLLQEFEGESVEVDESLFQEMDDLDLDDLDDEDLEEQSCPT